jgi:hypothetical protein
MPLASELLEIEQLIIRLKEPGETHELYGYVTQLQAKSDAVTASMKAFEVATHNVKIAEAEAAIVKESLVRRYELNYPEARKTCGRVNVEKLFPRFDYHRRPPPHGASVPLVPFTN